MNDGDDPSVVVLARDDRHRTELGRVLRLSGAHVSYCSTGSEVLDRLGDGSTQLVIALEEHSQEHGPDFSGLQAAACARTFGDMTPFVVVDSTTFGRTTMAASRLANLVVLPSISAAVLLLELHELAVADPSSRHASFENHGRRREYGSFEDVAFQHASSGAGWLAPGTS